VKPRPGSRVRVGAAGELDTASAGSWPTSSLVDEARADGCRPGNLVDEVTILALRPASWMREAGAEWAMT